MAKSNQSVISKYFKGSLVFAVVGIFLGLWIGHYYTQNWAGAFSMAFICAVLGVLEVSLSFDNAVVNATVLKDMTPLWRHRFLTWGMLIAVFGMRLVFPLAIVGFVAQVNPWDALVFAALKPNEYAQIMQSVHIPVAAFGGGFLLMVALRYFFDPKKDVHWFHFIERPLANLGRLEGYSLAFAMVVIYLISRRLPTEHESEFLVSGLFGLITFILVDGLSAYLESSSEHTLGRGGVNDIHKASAGMFIYLEILDASFSFDGVIGAFAITNNLFIIAIGLGIGAMFVRSLTILLVEEETLTQYRYLEHGAFYAIGALAAIMFLNTVVHIPEVITGLIGALFIALPVYSSIRFNRRSKGSAT